MRVERDTERLVYITETGKVPPPVEPEMRAFLTGRDTGDEQPEVLPGQIVLQDDSGRIAMANGDVIDWRYRVTL